MNSTNINKLQPVSEQVPGVANRFVSEIMNIAENLKATGQISDDVYYDIIGDVFRWENSTEKLLQIYTQYGE